MKNQFKIGQKVLCIGMNERYALKLPIGQCYFVLEHAWSYDALPRITIKDIDDNCSFHENYFVPVDNMSATYKEFIELLFNVTITL